MATQEEYDKMSAAEKKKEDWMNSKWRPMMGWMYMAVCMADFVLFPVLWSLVQAIHGGQVATQWSPITLQGAGLFHMAMGAILGIAAFGRTQEKLNGANNGGLAPAGSGFGAPTGGFGSAPQAGGFGAPSGGFGGGGFGSTPPMVPRSTTVTTTFGSASPSMSSTGKPMPMQPDQPEL